MNWGNKLLLVFIVFAAGMGYLIYRSLHTNFELVAPDYYATELRYQQVIDDSRRANGLSEEITLHQNEKGILLQLPAEMKNKKPEGSITFYCAYDRKNDRTFSLVTGEDASQLIPVKNLMPGNYTVKFSWKEDSKGYYFEKDFTVL
jgi:hypothetical protein